MRITVSLRGRASCLVFVICVWAPGFSNVYAQTVRYVDADAPGVNDGTSWEDAFRDLQDALDAATDGDEIRVAGGVYKPDRGTGDRLATFSLQGGLTLRGGYAGFGAPDPDLRDLDAYPTVLSGDLGDDDGPQFENNAENSRHIVTVNEVESAVLIDGLVLRGGHDDAATGGRGPAAVITLADVTFRHCTFLGNMASGDGATGGAILAVVSSVKLIGCTFVGNTSGGDGGGFHNLAGTLSIEDGVFEQNTAGLFGGALRSVGGEVDLLRSTFFANSASFGGAMSNHGAEVAIAECRFIENRASFNGGALQNLLSPSVITDSELSGNVAGRGGGIYSTGRAHVIENCTFRDNVVRGAGGAIGLINVEIVKIHNCLFSENRSHAGGALFAHSGADLNVSNCTFLHNTASFRGGAISVRFLHPLTVVNSIVWGNHAEPISSLGSELVVTYSDVEFGFPGEGNFDKDPLLGSDDVPLPRSPVINAGDPELGFEPGERDFAGRPRVLCKRVDMGAYEFGIGDFSCDREVGLDDYVAWLDCMTGPEGGPYERKCEAFDFDADGDVDVQDFAGMQGVLGRS